MSASVQECREREMGRHEKQRLEERYEEENDGMNQQLSMTKTETVRQEQ